MRWFVERAWNAFMYVFCFHLLYLPLELLPNHSLANRFRGLVLGVFARRCGGGFMLARGSTLNMMRRLEVGRGVYLAHNCWINAVGGVKIGDGVVVSPNVVIASSKHDFVDGRVSLARSSFGPVEIQAGAWIASGAVITMGVKIGQGAMIGANSVVSCDVPPGEFWGGVPAKRIGLVPTLSSTT